MVDLVKVTPVDADGEGKGVEVLKSLTELTAALPAATETASGTVMQVANIAAEGGDFGSLTAVTTAWNGLLAAMKAAGVMVDDA